MLSAQSKLNLEVDLNTENSASGKYFKDQAGLSLSHMIKQVFPVGRLISKNASVLGKQHYIPQAQRSTKQYKRTKRYLSSLKNPKLFLKCFSNYALEVPGVLGEICLFYENQETYGTKSVSGNGTLSISRLHMVRLLAAWHRDNRVSLFGLVLYWKHKFDFTEKS